MYVANIVYYICFEPHRLRNMHTIHIVTGHIHSHTYTSCILTIFACINENTHTHTSCPRTKRFNFYFSIVYKRDCIECCIKYENLMYERKGCVCSAFTLTLESSVLFDAEKGITTAIRYVCLFVSGRRFVIYRTHPSSPDKRNAPP